MRRPGFTSRLVLRMLHLRPGRAKLCGRACVAGEGATPPAELYAAILEIHPFLDGNLRAAYVALQVGLASLGLPTVRFGHTIDRHDECLGWAMRSDADRTIAPLAELIVELAQ